MRETGTRPWDPAEHLETAEDMVAYLEAALEQEDPPARRGRARRHRKSQGHDQSRPGGRTGKREPLQVAVDAAATPSSPPSSRSCAPLGLRLRAAPSVEYRHRAHRPGWELSGPRYLSLRR